MAKSSGGGGRVKPATSGARQQPAVGSEAQWPTTMMALGILIFIIVFWTVGQRTLIAFTELFRWFALFAFAGNLLPRRWYAKRFAMDHLEWFWFNLLAVGPLILCCCLLLNFLLHGPEERMLVQQGRSFDLQGYWREERSLPPHLPWPSNFGADSEKDRLALSTANPGDKVYALAEGCLGYLVVTEATLIRERQPATPDN